MDPLPLGEGELSPRPVVIIKFKFDSLVKEG